MTRLSAVFDGLLLTLARLAAAIFAAVAVMIPVNLVFRNVFGASIYGLLDLVEYGILAATFLAAPWVLAINGHVAVDLVVHALKGRARRTVERAASLVGAAVSAILLVYALQALLLSAGRGTMVRTAFTFPEWWVLTPMPLAMALILIEFARKIARGPGAHDVAGL